jgi:hypothetical protein
VAGGSGNDRSASLPLFAFFDDWCAGTGAAGAIFHGSRPGFKNP